jgi:hypothetical protein
MGKRFGVIILCALVASTDLHCDKFVSVTVSSGAGRRIIVS